MLRYRLQDRLQGNGCRAPPSYSTILDHVGIQIATLHVLPHLSPLFFDIFPCFAYISNVAFSSYNAEVIRRQNDLEARRVAARGEDPPAPEPEPPAADDQGNVPWIADGEAIRTELSVSGWMVD